MSDGSVVVEVNVDDKQAQKELNSITQKIERISEKLKDQNTGKTEIVNQSAQLGAQLDAAKAKLEYMTRVFYIRFYSRTRKKCICFTKRI